MSGIQIGTLSAMLGIAPSAIRFYEECGLVKPQKDSQSGYRYFSPIDCSKLMGARSFRSMGFSIQESNSLIHEQSAVARMEIWNTGEINIDRQIQRLEAQKRILGYWKDLSACHTELMHTCQAFERTGFYYLSLGSWGTIKGTADYRNIVDQWISFMPEASYWGLFDTESLAQGKDIIPDCGFGIQEECVIREKLEMPPQAAYYPPCHCIQSVIHCQADMTTIPAASFSHVMRYVQQHDLKLYGTGHWHFLQLSEYGDGSYVFSFPVTAKNA